MKHILNVVKDAYDHRDHVVAPNAASNPVILSFRSQVAYIKDQGSAGSCTAHAGSEHLEMSFRKHLSNLPASIDRSVLRFSPLFLYGRERMMEGTFAEDAGAQSRTIFRVLSKYGCCLETEDPYDAQNIYMQPTNLQMSTAALYKLNSYHRVLDVDTAKTVLQSGYSFTIGMPVFQSLEGDEVAVSGLVPVPTRLDNPIGGHEMHVVGCDDSKNVLGHVGAFEVQNSWGSGWGDHGFCWVPYDYLKSVEGEYDMWLGHFGAPWKPKA